MGRHDLNFCVMKTTCKLNSFFSFPAIFLLACFFIVEKLLVPYDMKSGFFDAVLVLFSVDL